MPIKSVFIEWDRPDVEGMHHDYYRIRILPAGTPFALSEPYHQLPNVGDSHMVVNASQLSISPTEIGLYDIYVTTATEAETESGYVLAPDVLFSQKEYTDLSKPAVSQLNDLLERNMSSRFKGVLPFEDLLFYAPEPFDGITNTRLRVGSMNERFVGEVYTYYNRITPEKFFAIKPQYIKVAAGTTLTGLVAAINAASNVSFVIGTDFPSQSITAADGTWRSVTLNMAQSLAFCGSYQFFYSTQDPA